MGVLPAEGAGRGRGRDRTAVLRAPGRVFAEQRCWGRYIKASPGSRRLLCCRGGWSGGEAERLAARAFVQGLFLGSRARLRWLHF